MHNRRNQQYFKLGGIMRLQITDIKCNKYNGVTSAFYDEVEVEIVGRASYKEMYYKGIYDEAVRCGALDIRPYSTRPVPVEKTIRLDWCAGINNLKIKEVIFNEPATIVYWEDGTKTVVKCQDGDTYDKEKGLALCYMKKITGNKSGNFNKVLKEWVK